MAAEKNGKVGESGKLGEGGSLGVKALMHATSIANVGSILQSGWLMTPKDLADMKKSAIGYTSGDWEAGGQFMGVYMLAVNESFTGVRFSRFEDDRSPFPDLSGVCVLVFSSGLLGRDDWHLNLADQNGYITRLTYVKQTLPLALDQIQPTSDMNEVVFHNKVPIEPCLREIWILAKDNKEWKASYTALVNQFSASPALKVYIPKLRAEFMDRFPKLHAFPKCTVLPAEQTHKPRLCSAYNGAETDNPRIINSTMDTLRIAKNCGFTPAEISQLLKDSNLAKSTQPIRDAIFQREIYFIKNPDKIPPPAALPPFTPQSIELLSLKK